MEALTNTSVKLNKFPERDLNIFLELLKAINYDPSLDRKSKRRDFLIEHYTPPHLLTICLTIGIQRQKQTSLRKK